jgi:glycosyltransferase involved in cell wall biosynthesis
VSVLTPSFNQGRWLVNNLRSVAGQDYPNIEHIVMDGGSTDDSVDILERSDDRVRWWSESDLGQSHALNKALAASRGEILGWLNSDDAYFDPFAVGAAVRVFTDRPDVDVVYGHAALVNAEGLLLQMLWMPRFRYSLLRRHNFISQPAAFIRRAALDKTIADESYQYAMDRELWLRLSARHRFERLDRIVAIDRHHYGRKSYLWMDEAEADRAQLAATYGVPRTRVNKALQKGLKIGFRLRGLTLLGEIGSGLTFSALLDSRWRLAVRQVAVLRSAMPAGSAMPAADPPTAPHG